MMLKFFICRIENALLKKALLFLHSFSLKHITIIKYIYKSISEQQDISHKKSIRVPTSSGNHGEPGKSPKKVPCMEKSWNLKKELINHGKVMGFCEII